MNGDEELLMAIRELRTTVTMTAPVEQIIGRGRAIRASRRILAMAAILTVMTVAVFAAAEMAQTVATGLRHARMAVDVALHGPAGLERALVNGYDVIVLDRDLPGARMCWQAPTVSLTIPNGKGVSASKQ